MVYKKGLIAEFIGNIKATVQAYITGSTLMILDCTRMQTITRGTQVKKSVKTMTDIFAPMRISSPRPRLRPAFIADLLTVKNIVIYRAAIVMKQTMLIPIKTIIDKCVASLYPGIVELV